MLFLDILRVTFTPAMSCRMLKYGRSFHQHKTGILDSVCHLQALRISEILVSMTTYLRYPLLVALDYTVFCI